MPLAETDINYLREIVATHSGHMISSAQGYLFESRLQPVAEEVGLTSVSDLVAELKRPGQRKVLDNIIAEAMTINETFFFRDMHPFDALRTDMIPTLMASRQRTRQLTIWCAACSTGQEPYSIAITLREYFPELSDWKIRVLATDLSDDVLAKAEKGEFSQFEVNRGLPAKFLVKYFDRDGSTWTIKSEIRSMLEFSKTNLTKPWPVIPKCEIVFMRNVLIYFSTQTKAAILARLRKTVVHDGYLVLGGGETLLNVDASFERETIGGTVCYRPSN